jgi:hypothetical protein
MYNQSNRELGDRFDAWALAQLAPYVTGLKPTVASGSVFGDQDQVSQEFRVSAKLRTNVGLTRAEIEQPWDCEAIGTLRVPLTVLRVVDTKAERQDDYVVVGAGPFMTFYGKDLVLMVISEFLDFDVIESWPGGLTRGLLSKVSRGHMLILFGFPDKRDSIAMTFPDFLDVMARIQDYIQLQKAE